VKIRLVEHGNFTLINDVNVTIMPPENGFYWLDATIEDLAELQVLFHLDDLAIEDVLSEEEQRPKIEIYDSHYFIVINSIRFDDESFFLRSLNMFLGKHYIITMTKQKINEVRFLKPILLEEEVNTPDRFVYHIIDLIIDNYFIVGDRFENKLEKLEEDIIVNTRKSHLTEIIGLRSEILWLKKVLVPQRDLVAILHKRDLKLIHDTLQKYFGDVYENAVKITETFETYRDLMSNLREAYQASLASRANEIMRIFTALTTIFMPLTFITGVYGMNFTNLPGRNLPGGEYIVFGGMLALGFGMLWFFRKKEWL